MIHHFPAVLAAALASLQPTPGEISMFVGPPGGVGNVETIDEQGSPATSPVPGLQGILLLPIDFAGRTELLELMPDRPRLRPDVPGASRLQLPGGHGSLYRYSRDDGLLGTAFGFFTVDPAGEARGVWERTGTGLNQDQDPFIDRIAVSPSGTSMLVATLLAAGGDLIEVGLLTGATIDRTSLLAPQDFDGSGLALQDDWGVAVSSAGILRFPRVSAADAQFVPFAGGAAPSWFARELVLSLNGRHAATIAGSGPTQADVFVMSDLADARRVSGTPADLTGAGLLPGAQGGPYLAVSDDGTLCAWRVERATSTEILLGRVPQPGGSPLAMQITRDAAFTDTGTEVGPIPFFLGTSLLMAFGEPGDPLHSPIESMDWFQVGLPAGASTPTFTNLSQSSGDTQVPFSSLGLLNPSHMVWVPQAQAFLMLDSLGGGVNRLITVDPLQSGVTEILTDIKDLDFIEVVNGEILVAVRRSFDPRPRELHRIPGDTLAFATLLLSQPDNDEPLRWAVKPGGFRVAVVFPDPLTNAEWIWRLNVNFPGSPRLFTTRPLRYGSTIIFTPGGAIAFSVGIPAVPSRPIAWPFGGAPLRRLLPFNVRSFLLPGS